jgi:hypothetical protein
MSGQNDANIKVLYPVDNGSFFAIDTVQSGQQFQVVANIEVGANIMQVVNKEDVKVAVTNLMTGAVTTGTFSSPLAPVNSPHNEEIRVDFPTGVTGTDGDVLQAVATYRVTAGVNTDLSVETSEYFVIEA